MLLQLAGGAHGVPGGRLPAALLLHATTDRGVGAGAVRRMSDTLRTQLLNIAARYGNPGENGEQTYLCAPCHKTFETPDTGPWTTCPHCAGLAPRAVGFGWEGKGNE